MSEKLTHECGIAVVRLLKPLSYYQAKYGSPIWGFNKLFLLMEKQHNRGQDGAGLASVKFDVPKGEAFMFRERDVDSNPLDRVFKRVLKAYNKLVDKNIVVPEFADTVKAHFDFGGEVLMGHLRYGTSGGYSISSCHPFFRRSPWLTRNLALLGNFNMTNTRELNDSLIDMGQHPIFATDTQALLEKIGYYLDKEHDDLYRQFRAAGLSGKATSEKIAEEFDLARVITRASTKWDGGYVLCGAIGTGDLFVARDPNGIRPCWYYKDDEVIAFASERAPLMTVFSTGVDTVHEVAPGSVTVVKKNGTITTSQFTPQKENAACSFERIYFSRGNDLDIYRERKLLGGYLAEGVLKAINHDLGNAIFSSIPNTSEVAYLGLLHELRDRRRAEIKAKILEAVQAGILNESLLEQIIVNSWPRSERVVGKDIKMRTFIGKEANRIQLANHVYDITYGSVKPGNYLVCIDDSIVRGTTLRQSILKMLMRLEPCKIVIASTAPQIRYPDCYGIDMPDFGKFVAFEAVISLIKESGKESLLADVYRDCLKAVADREPVNHVRRIYKEFTADQISRRIAELVTPKDVEWKGEVEFVFQSLENLHKAVPNNPGDWYFSGHYPTLGGYMFVNNAYIRYFEKKEGRFSEEGDVEEE